jgi:integron integrase
MRRLGLSRRTEEAYVGWIRRFILANGKRHPEAIGAREVEAFLTLLAVRGQVAASTQNQALAALLFLYREVLQQRLPWMENVQRAKRPQRLPAVLTREEAVAVLDQLGGTSWLMASLLYGSGLRLMECLRLRVKDIDFGRRELTVRDGKGGKDRRTMLPAALVAPLQAQLDEARRVHERDLAAGFGAAWLPDALARKFPNVAREWGWQYMFPASVRSVDPRSGRERRHHLDESMLQRHEHDRDTQIIMIADKVVAAARRTGDATLLAAYEQTIKHSREVARTRAMQIGQKSARAQGTAAKKEGGED